MPHYWTYYSFNQRQFLPHPTYETKLGMMGRRRGAGTGIGVGGQNPYAMTYSSKAGAGAAVKKSNPWIPKFKSWGLLALASATTAGALYYLYLNPKVASELGSWTLNTVTDVSLGFANVILDKKDFPLPTALSPPSRAESLARVVEASKKAEEFDVLVIGGGVVGSGVALDAAVRGLKVCLLEAEDFSSGSSSRSSKLLHGGGLTLMQNAVKSLDCELFKLVRSCVQERDTLLHTTAPHLTKPVPMLYPVFSWSQVPLAWLSAKLYSWMSKSSESRLISANEALLYQPILDYKRLKCAIYYHEGVHDDARTGLYIALTAACYGACVVNYMAVEKLISNAAGQITGVLAKETIPTMGKDQRQSSTIPIRAKVVVNATGTSCERILGYQSTDSGVAPPPSNAIVTPVRGTNLSLCGAHTSRGVGLVAESSASQSMLVVPYFGRSIVGMIPVSKEEVAIEAMTKADMATIKEQVVKFCNAKVASWLAPNAAQGSPMEVKSAWSGLLSVPSVSSAWSDRKGGKPAELKLMTKNSLAQDGGSQGKEGFAVFLTKRKTGDANANDLVGSLVNVTGGNWSIYRLMAETTVNQVIKSLLASKMTSKVPTSAPTPTASAPASAAAVANTEPSPSAPGPSKSVTRNVVLLGHFTAAVASSAPSSAPLPPTNVSTLRQKHPQLSVEVAQRLVQNYGDRCGEVADLAALSKYRPLLTLPQDSGKLNVSVTVPLEGEVEFALREYACTAADVVIRRCGLACLDYQVAKSAVARVVDLLAARQSWSAERCSQELAYAHRQLGFYEPPKK